MKTMAVILHHGTDNPDGAEAFVEHRLHGGEYFNNDDIEIPDGLFKFSDKYTVSNAVYLTPSYNEALRQAKYAVITIKIDASWLVQVCDTNYIMPDDAEYEIVNVEQVDGSQFTMIRTDSGFR